MPGGCFKVHTINVVDPPPAITGTMEMCPGGNVTLSNPATGGRWLSLSPASATIDTLTGVVHGITPDVISIRYTAPSGCMVYTNVTVNPIPSPIIGRDTFCVTDKDTMYDATPSGNWSSITPSIATISAATGVLTTVTNGVGTIRYTLPTGCFVTKSFMVNKLPTPVAAFNVFTGQFETTDGYVSYQWYHSIFGLLAGATTTKVAGVYPGNYYVVVTDTNGCVGTSPAVAFTSWNGVSNVATQGTIHIYPNPAYDVVNIDVRGEVKVVIAAMDGKALIEESNTHTINISRLPAGIYLLSVYNKDGAKISVDKLIKE